MRLERQDAAPPSQHPAWAQQRSVFEALEPIERPPADRAGLLGAALDPRQGTRPWPRPTAERRGKPGGGRHAAAPRQATWQPLRRRHPTLAYSAAALSLVSATSRL